MQFLLLLEQLSVNNNMAIISNIWNRVVGWFEDRSDRTKLIRGFNRAAKDSFVNGITPVLLQANISRGHRPYRHHFSNLIGGSGFRIKTMSGYQLSKQDIVNIGSVVLADNLLVRRMVVLGFDTLEIHCDVGSYGCRWQLHDFIMIGGTQNE